MKVSIIIPVYNVAPYIKRCLDSVASQTYTGYIECILIDDCATDDSIKIAKQWIKEYIGNIHFTTFRHSENQGQSAARNTGIKVASGEYVFFLDSDDAITPDCISILVRLAEKYPKADFVQGDMVQGLPGLTVLQLKHDIPEYAKDMASKSRLIFASTMTSPCNKLIQKSFITSNSLYFPVGIFHEDLYWLYFVEKHTREVAFTNTGTYCYYANEGSTMNSISKENRKKRINGYRVSVNAFFGDMLENGSTSIFQRQFVADAMYNYLQYVSSCHSSAQWLKYWKEMTSLAIKARHKITFHRLLLFFNLLPPLCFLVRFSSWRWRIRHFVISNV